MGVTADDGDGGMAVCDSGEGGGRTGVVGLGDETGAGDELGECGAGDGEMAMDGDVPRLN